MTLIPETLTVDCADWPTLVTFWSALLEYTDDPQNPNAPGDPEGLIIGPAGGPSLLFLPVPEPKTVKNRLHLDLTPVGATRDEEVDRAVGLGATVVDDRREPDGPGWVVLADPEGNEFCILRSAAERAEYTAAHAGD
ncbi:VOC family protein [Jatrophihabitans sp. YIM 134969]